MPKWRDHEDRLCKANAEYILCLESVPSSTIQYGEKLENALLENLFTEGAKASYSGRILLTPTKSPQRTTEVIIKVGKLTFSHPNLGGWNFLPYFSETGSHYLFATYEKHPSPFLMAKANPLLCM